MFMMFIKLCFLLLSFLSLCCFGLPRLHPDEAIIIRQIVEALGARLLNSTEDPCQSGKLSYIEQSSYYLQNNSVICKEKLDNFHHITNIVLKYFDFQGSLPPELANLTYLEQIDLSFNYLSGKLPTAWASMQYLTNISLTGNNLSGEIPPEWGNLTSLTVLSLEANQLSGAIPEELGNLVNLFKLELSSNQLSGELPKTLARMKNMTKFRISDNRFSGRVPEFIGELTNLQMLDMYSTGLEGPIPGAIFGLVNVIDLRITDMIEPKFNFPNLTNMITSKKFTNLILRNLNISGPIPPYVFRVTNILDLTFNNLEGEIKLTGDTAEQEYMFLSGNMLSGNIPNSFLSRQKPSDLSYNNFTMIRCPSASDYINMYRSFSSNKSGSLSCPSRPGCQRYYRSLHINCGGQSEMVNNTVYDGDLQVSVSGTAAAFKYNSGEKWGVISAGNFMDRKGNREGGFTLPSNNTSLMRYPKLYSTARASPLFLTYYGYCLENGNYTVNLHFAEILFNDEVPYHRAGRRLFDIHSQGILVEKDFNIKEIANGTGKEIIRSFNTTVTDNTLEIRLYWAGKGTTCIPLRGDYGPIISAISICYGFSKTSCDEPPKSKIPIIVGVVTSVSFLILFVVGFFCWKRYFGQKNTRELELRGQDLQTGTFTYRQLKAATNNFDTANKIGEGGFGSVYKGQLSDGTVIAVKQLSSKSRQGNREFVNEIGMISGLQHPNLVKLFGCCVAGDQLLLVYEYMENNCLANALFGSEGTLKLDWATRQKICVGIARGLAFLHEESTLKIVHRDIKATNVLLDKALNAKISDFGLAKLKEDDNTHISTRIAGTIGYMAPEYALYGYLTEKADVYSFGVVALEIVSGRNNAGHRAKNECVPLVEVAFDLQKKRMLMEIVDPKLENEFNMDEVERMIKLALLCCNASPALRPTMSEVVSMLEAQTIISEVISDPSIYGNDLQLMNQNYTKLYKNTSGSQDSIFPSDKTGIGSSTTSAHDLYSVNWESIRDLTTSRDLHPLDSDTISLAKS